MYISKTDIWRRGTNTPSSLQLQRVNVMFFLLQIFCLILLSLVYIHCYYFII